MPLRERKMLYHKEMDYHLHHGYKFFQYPNDENYFQPCSLDRQGSSIP